MAVSFRLYLITDRTLVPDLPAAVDRALAAIPPGAAAVQLREKELSARALFELAVALRPICRARNAPLLVNDRLDVALAADLDGVHLGGGSVDVADARTLLGDRLIGAS
jgi:thiamine-phosphate pyrophosphorylase